MMQCHVCGLSLVASPHLARSYHHLFPVKPFAEVPADEVAGSQVRWDAHGLLLLCGIVAPSHTFC